MLPDLAVMRLKELVQVLNPKKEQGRLMLITRRWSWVQSA